LPENGDLAYTGHYRQALATLRHEVEQAQVRLEHFPRPLVCQINNTTDLGIHELRRFPLRDQIYRPQHSARSDGETPFQTAEGLSIGVDVAVRFGPPDESSLIVRKLLETRTVTVAARPRDK
jgi:hypothetical protein